MNTTPHASRTSDLRHQRGFTLVEIVVVIAVISILGAITAPLVAKSIDDSRAARAANETAVIAAAIGSFYKDTGRWPTRGFGNVDGAVTTLTSGNPNAGPNGGCAVDNGGSINQNGWNSDPVNNAATDLLHNHLVRNLPKALVSYPTTGDTAWRGPYMDMPSQDPWNMPYMVNIAATDPTSSAFKAVVISAGPNGVMDTPFNLARDGQAQGDDIMTTLHVR